MTFTGTEVGIETSRPPSLILESVRNKRCHGTANNTNPVSIYNLLKLKTTQNGIYYSNVNCIYRM